MSNNKKNIFFLINSLENGGAERVLSTVLPLLSKNNNIYLLLLKDKIFYDLPKNIKIISFSKVGHNFLMIPLFPFYIWKFNILIEKYKPYKIISSLELSNFINILSNKNAIISFETSLGFFNKGLFNKLYLTLIYILYPRAKKIIVNSRENKLNISKQLKIPLRKIIVIYNPLDIKTVNQLKNKSVHIPFTMNNNLKIFVTVGRLNKQKNISAIINTFKNLSPENILLIIGDGPEMKNLKKLIVLHNLRKQVFLLGRQKNVYKYLNIADYFIFSSEVEGFPNVLIEAMACGLPIITSDFKTGAKEIIDPALPFNTNIEYPYYGPNGVLLSISNFQNDFYTLNFDKIFQLQHGLQKFELSKIAQQRNSLLQK